MSIDFFLYQEGPDVETLWDLLLGAGADSESNDPNVFKGLLIAWEALSDLEELDYLSFEEAEKLYKKVFIRNYNKGISPFSYDEEDCCHWWPESMSTGHPVPKKVVVRVAQIMASKELARVKSMRMWLKREHPEEFEAVVARESEWLKREHPGEGQ